MEKSELIGTIQELIGNSDTAAALETLISFLEGEPKYKALLKVAISQKAYHQRTIEQASLDQITDEVAEVRYNNINQSILKLAGDLEAGRLRPSVPDTVANTPGFKLQKWQLILLAILVLVISLGVFFYIKTNSNRVSCPDFLKDSELNVLVLPYTKIGVDDDGTEVSIRDRLQKKCRENSLSASIRFFDRYFEQKNAQIPSFENVDNIGQSCNSELVIWGLAEKSTDQYELVTNFKYLGAQTNLNYQQIQTEGEALVDTVATISSILKEGSITREVEDLILMLFGIVAHQKGMHQQAINAINQASPGTDTTEIVWSNMILADSYLEVNKADSAIIAYDKLLSASPANKLALNNRGHLFLEKGKYLEAVKDLSSLIDQDPESEEPRVARAIAYLNMDETEKAKVDLDQAKRLNPKIKVPKLAGKNKSNIDQLEIAVPKKAIFFKEDSYQHVYLHEESEAITLSGRLPLNYTIILGNTIKTNQKASTHEIILNVPQGRYAFEIKSQGVGSFKMALEDKQTNRAFTQFGSLLEENLNKGVYKLNVQRERAIRDLYYEIKITYLGV